MTPQEKAVIEAAKELVKLRHPSLVKILKGDRRDYEAEKAQSLMDAVDALDESEKPKA